MREDRGWLCLPETDLSMAFTPGTMELLVAKLGVPLASRAMITAHRYTGPEAHAAGMVAEAVPEGAVLERAIQLAAKLATKDPATLQAIKGGLYARVLGTLAS